MRGKLSFTTFSVCLILSCAPKTDEGTKEKIIKLPLTIVDGYGPFSADYTFLKEQYSKEDTLAIPWNQMYKTLAGIPKDWKQVIKSQIILNHRQLIYQNYLAGKVREDMYASLQRSWKWTPDHDKLSEKPIKCEVYSIRGLDKSGKMAVMIDSDNDLDFGDETAFYAQTADNYDDLNIYKKPVIVDYEVYQDGQILTKKAPIVVKFMKNFTQGEKYWYSIPQYALAKLTLNGKDYEIAVRRGFTSPEYDMPSITQTNRSKNDKKIRLGQGIAVDEFLTLVGNSESIKYRNKGVDTFHDFLELEGTPADKVGYSLQVGYPFQPFKTKEFSTGQSISTSDYKGKYVLIDFWGTWCKGCVEELPELRKIYQNTDRKKVEFIGIAGHDTPGKLSKFLKKQPLPWPQILSDSINNLIEIYKIDGFPTKVLLGPDGKVVAKNMAGEELRKKLEELTRKEM